MESPKILVLIPTLKDDPTETILSIKQQTINVSKIIVVVGARSLFRRLLNSEIASYVKILYFKPDMKEYVGLRVAKGLNYALSTVKIENYDYILRVDADVILPPDFIEKNLRIDADVVGKAGYAMLIKTSSFLKVFKGRFREVNAEDSYFNLKFSKEGYKVKSWLRAPVLMRRSGRHHSYRYYVTRGIEMYRLGYEPLHVIENLRRDFRNIFCVYGYALALFKKIKRYEFASWVFKTQLRRIIYGKKS